MALCDFTAPHCTCNMYFQFVYKAVIVFYEHIHGESMKFKLCSDMHTVSSALRDLRSNLVYLLFSLIVGTLYVVFIPLYTYMIWLSACIYT